MQINLIAIYTFYKYFANPYWYHFLFMTHGIPNKCINKLKDFNVISFVRNFTFIKK